MSSLVGRLALGPPRLKIRDHSGRFSFWCPRRRASTGAALHGPKLPREIKSGYMAEHPEQISDTDPRTMEVWLAMLRKKTPGERIAMAFELSDFAVRVAESGARARHLGASEREVFLRAAALRLPRDLMIRAYGWDPETRFEEHAHDLAAPRVLAGVPQSFGTVRRGPCAPEADEYAR